MGLRVYRIKFVDAMVKCNIFLIVADMDMGALMTVCTLAITLLLVYGTIKGKATHLLPFFCLQLFDFAITT